MKQFKSVDFTLNVELKDQIDKEVAILKQVDNENVIRFFDFFTVFLPEMGHIFYLVTEFYQVFFRFCANLIFCIIHVFKYLKEGSLDKAIAEKAIHKQTFENEIILKWTNQLLNALEYLHDSKRIVHRDVKPGYFHNWNN